MRFARFCGDEQGMTTVEYALILAIVVCVCIATWGAFGGNVRNGMTQASAGYDSVNGRGG
ncbi:MAG TPA: Flp family type IVb pilin [Armatimonadota bacterium]|jgi:Flp pilus assembly pilin Flp